MFYHFLKDGDRYWLENKLVIDLSYPIRVAASGGVIRDQNGQWVWGFAKNAGTCTVMEAEFWGCIRGTPRCMGDRDKTDGSRRSWSLLVRSGGQRWN
ncbi:hypothetical protein PVK06_025320 [Gossypium arboreum]|uniref:RNase H type-1 domain-containing protein n=1 Tax=Gossypium arboreum TaxID=29729 RepID=A0ABR0PGS1_GOSAR|nr:hypothetical protein PVK06_025320 [Gossypium arboreum]